MKKANLILPMIAFAVALMASFALKANKAFSEEMWYLDAQGERDELVVGEPQCAGATNDCAQLFEVDGGNYTPIGEPIKGVRY